MDDCGEFGEGDEEEVGLFTNKTSTWYYESRVVHLSLLAAMKPVANFTERKVENGKSHALPNHDGI